MTKNLLFLFVGVLGFPSAVWTAQSQPAVRGMVVEAAAPSRRALIIGNANYAAAAPLQNTINDARAVTTTLGDLGFQVQNGENLDGIALDRAINTFVEGIGAGDVALFYYSGHGMELSGENYLIPVDFRARDEAEAKHQAYSANVLLEKLEARKPRLTIIILDACRNNPFPRGTRGGGVGLAQMQAGAGVYIAFAAKPGQTASDNPEGKNGLFTGQLVEVLAKPDMDLNQVFDEVRARVSGASAGAQLPFATTSVIGSFVFRDISLQQKNVHAELARLQAELTSINKELSSSLADRQRRETVRRAADLEQRVRLQRFEEERLTKEADRRKNLEAEQNRLLEQFNPNDTARQRQRQAEEANIVELRRKLELGRLAVAETRMGKFTLAMARQEVTSLRKTLDAAKLAVDGQKLQAIQKLDQDYAPLRQAAATTLTKDAFESTAEFESRVNKQSIGKAAVDLKYRDERAAIERRYAEEATAQAGLYLKQISAIQGRNYVTPDVKPQSVTYDADAGVFTLRVENERFYLPMDRDQARGLFARRDLLSIDFEVPYYDSLGPARAQDPDNLKRGVARIGLINGDVSVRRGDSGDWVATVINAPLLTDDRVATGPNSRTEVQFDTSYLLHLGASGEVRLTQLEYGRYQMELARGVMTYRVLSTSDGNVEIDTPSLSVRPSGQGSFRLSVNQAGETEVTARNGDVEVFTPRGALWVRDGQTLMARGANTDAESQVVPAGGMDDWDRWSDSRDPAQAPKRGAPSILPVLRGRSDSRDPDRAPRVPSEIRLKDPGSGQTYTARKDFTLKVSSAPAPTVDVGRHPVVRALLLAAADAMQGGHFSEAATYFTDILRAGGSIPLPVLHFDRDFD